MNEYDFCVVGGGMIGASTALGLAKLGYQVALVEPCLPKASLDSDGPDIRVSAINLASQNLLQTLGAWKHIPESRIEPFVGMEVSENERSKTTFYSEQINRPFLGHIIENKAIQLAVHQQISVQENIESFCQHKISQIEFGNANQIFLDSGEKLRCRFIIGADGGNSMVRKANNMGEQGWQYKQHAMGITIKLAKKHDQVTWQRFRPSGPIAFLPLFEQYACLVWYDNPKVINDLKRLDSAALQKRVEIEFADGLGDFSILDKAAFPLTRMHANRYLKGHTMLIGDAAHTINPLAGQGVNLGFQDVECLLGCLTSHMSDQHILDAMAAYEKQRRKANLLMMTAMDMFYTVFSNTISPLKVLRSQVLGLANKAGPIKLQVMKYAMGLR